MSVGHITRLDDLAADWLARLESPECSMAERAAFEDWLAASPRHVEAYLEAERLHLLAAGLADDELLRAAIGEMSPPAPRTASRTRRSRWRPWSAAVAAVLVLAIGAATWLRPQPPQVAGYATAVGEQREIVLEDGTRMLLDTDTRVETRFDADLRVVELISGRARFEVGQDPDRPFLVRAASGTVRDIGTTFQVSRRGDDIDVGLIEGIVLVSRGDDGPGRRLAPGEQLHVDPQGRFTPTRALDLEVANGWPRGELVFRKRRLDDLLVEMNRYSEVPLRLAEPELAGIAVSGVFRVDEQAALVEALRQGWGLRAESRDDGVFLYGPAE
ncbi:FecR family protein [Marilutibacter maris]|uniref:Membrane protein n=1 Tax=Marilutibacter maris TaxID=1605891 RepID=A0A2U9T2V9_9GAMM|nr:FecR domain-containing protein [Lysobacter maris]AWV06833.1 membrane protein [Lysobacter maris]